jgi:peptide-methionine (R)-S-oxide reductase
MESDQMTRRQWLQRSIGGVGGLVGLGAAARAANAKTASDKPFEFSLSEAEWKKRLSPDAFYVLREHGTERPFTSPLNKEKRDGTFACAGCRLPLYRSADKYDSGTGWPSFTRAISGNIGTRTDRSFFMVRTEVHCRRCGGHLGHVFDDGPPPTGKRHCINGDALVFAPAAGTSS